MEIWQCICGGPRQGCEVTEAHNKEEPTRCKGITSHLNINCGCDKHVTSRCRARRRFMKREIFSVGVTKQQHDVRAVCLLDAGMESDDCRMFEWVWTLNELRGLNENLFFWKVDKLWGNFFTFGVDILSSSSKDQNTLPGAWLVRLRENGGKVNHCSSAVVKITNLWATKRIVKSSFSSRIGKLDQSLCGT